ncbi:MAG: hypothetical protein ABL899_01165, partial [Nitrospira sp.]
MRLLAGLFLTLVFVTVVLLVCLMVQSGVSMGVESLVPRLMRTNGIDLDEYMKKYGQKSVEECKIHHPPSPYGEKAGYLEASFMTM